MIRPLRFWLCCLLISLGAPAGGAIAAPADIRLSADTEARWVPFELTPHNQIRFTLTIGDTRAVALLDTGLSDSVVSARFADGIGLRGAVTGQANAIGGPVAIHWAASPTIVLGGLTRTGGRIAIADTGAALGEGVDLMIGSDILSCCALDIDYDTRRFRILPSGRLPFRGESIDLRLAPDSGAYMTRVTLGDAELRPVIVDTGDGAALTLSRAAWNASGYRAPLLTSTIAFGMGGAIETDVAILPEMRIDRMRVREIEVRIESDGGFSDRVGAAGRLGSGFLLGYRALLDPRAGRMVLLRGARADAPPVRSTSGLLLAYESGRLRVLHVMRHSPAADSGWRAGDAICSADGAAVADTLSPAGLAGWTVGPPGRTVRLGLCDGTERTLTLRRFY